MKQSGNIVFTNMILVLSILVVSCGVKHSLKENILYQDASFSTDHLNKSKVVIGGMASESGYLSDKKRIKYGSLLSDILSAKYREKSYAGDIIHTTQFLYKIGEANYLKLLKQLDAEKKPGKDLIRFIHDTIPNIKYILFGYIAAQDITDLSSEKKSKDEKGKETRQITYKKIYSLTVEFQIVDMLLEKTVWHVAIDNNAVRTENVEEDDSIDSIGDLLTDIIFEDDQPADPARIKRKEVLEKIFSELADILFK